MNFNELKQSIQQISGTLRKNAISAVNIHLTVRNWLIGFYIVEFEQNGEDRAKYGAKLLQNLADVFDEEGLSYRNLKLYRQFYKTYPKISVYIPHFFQKYFSSIGQSPIAQFQLIDKEESTEQLLYVDKLVNNLSYTHLTLLFSIEPPLKRRFYETESIKGTWSVRELKRQIDTLYFERSGISRKPEVLSEKTTRAVHQ